MHTKENGVLCNGQQPGSAVHNFISQGEFEDTLKTLFFKVCRLGVDMMLEDRFRVSRRGGTGRCEWPSPLGDGL